MCCVGRAKEKRKGKEAEDRYTSVNSRISFFSKKADAATESQITMRVEMRKIERQLAASQARANGFSAKIRESAESNRMLAEALRLKSLAVQKVFSASKRGLVLLL